MKCRLDPATALKVITAGAGSSRMLEVRGPMMVKGDYSKALMKLEVWQKDMTIIADFARQAGAPTPLFSTTAPIYTAAVASGRGGEDTAAVCEVLEQMAGMRRKSRVRARSGRLLAGRRPPKGGRYADW
jgi:putative dehydrogenase